MRRPARKARRTQHDQQSSNITGSKEKAKHEFIDFVVIALYLAFFLCALSTYAMLLLRKYEISYLNYTFALINALVIAKIILVGEMAHVGRTVPVQREVER